MGTRDSRGVSRRTFLGRACLAPLIAGAPRSGRAPAVIVDRPNDIRIVEVGHAFEDFQYRAPYQFGGRWVDRVPPPTAPCRFRTKSGRGGSGFGSMTRGNAGASPAASQDDGLGAMRALADQLRDVTAA